MTSIQLLEEQIASTEQLLREYEARARTSPDDFSLELSTVSLRERLADLQKQLPEEHGLRQVRHKKALRSSHPPGWGLRRFAAFSFSQRTVTRVLEPVLRDMQKEHFDALAEGHTWKARMALIRGYGAFWSALLLHLPISLARIIHEIWRATTK